MSYITYLPSKLDTEIGRFKENSGNILIDYRQGTGSAPYLFGTSYEEGTTSNALEAVPSKVPTTTHLTGDASNYRTFSTDIAVFSEDYQRNTFVLMTNGILFDVEYQYTTFIKDSFFNEDLNVNGNTLEHKYIVKNCNKELPLNETVNYISPVVLELVEQTVGINNSFQSIVARKKALTTEFEITYDEYLVDLNSEEPVYPVMYCSERTYTDYGEDGSLVNPSLIDAELKAFKFFEGTLTNNSSYSTNIIPVSNFSKTGDNFTADGNSVLTDSYPNYYLYSKSKGISQDIVGFTINISPETGVLFHSVFKADGRELTKDSEADIGESSILFKTVYTGLLSSPFILLKFFPEESDQVTFKIDGNILTLDFSNSSKVYEDLLTKLYPLGIIPIPLKDNSVALIKTNNSEYVNIEAESLFTNVISKPIFSETQYLNSPTTITYNKNIHPGNFSFSYIEDESTTEERENIIFKGSLTGSLNDLTAYLKPFLRIKVDTTTLNNGTYTFKLDLEGLVEKTVSVELTAGTNVANVISTIVSKLTSTFFEGKYFVKKYRDKDYFDIISKDIDNLRLVKLNSNSVLSIDNENNPSWITLTNGSKAVVLRKYDNSIVDLSCTAAWVVNSTKISGTGNVGTTVTVVDESNTQLKQAVVPSNGVFSITLDYPITDNKSVFVFIQDSDDNESDRVTLIGTKDTLPPTELENVVFSENGKQITGKTEPSAKVVLTTMSDVIVATVTATVSGDFTINLSTAMVTGESAKVILTDSSGNISPAFVIQMP